MRETGVYDASTGASLSLRAIRPWPSPATLCTGAGCTPTTEVTDYAYDDLGNLTSKTDYGSVYQYGAVTWDAASKAWVRGPGTPGRTRCSRSRRWLARAGGTGRR